MDKEHILAMPVGRKLDALVAEFVMGMEIVPDTLKHEPRYYLPDYDRVYHRSVPEYSTDISAAFEVVDNIRTREDKFGAYVDIHAIQDYWVVKMQGVETHQASDESLPLAICRAALLAVMEL